MVDKMGGRVSGRQVWSTTVGVGVGVGCGVVAGGVGVGVVGGGDDGGDAGGGLVGGMVAGLAELGVVACVVAAAAGVAAVPVMAVGSSVVGSSDPSCGLEVGELVTEVVSDLTGFDGVGDSATVVAAWRLTTGPESRSKVVLLEKVNVVVVRSTESVVAW